MKLIFYKDGALGDIAVLVPLFLELREQVPTVSLTLITSEGLLSPFLENSGIIDFRISSATGDIYKTFSKSGSSEFLNALQGDRTFFISTRVSTAYQKAGSCIISPLPPSGWNKFIAFYYIREVFARLGVESPENDWNFVHNRVRNAATALGIGKNNQHERVTFHPGSGSKKKNLKSPDFLNLLDSVQSEKYRKTLILGPVELERLDENTISQYRERVDETFIAPDINVLVEILLNTKFYFGMDSGVTHLANLCAENVFAFFGTTNPKLWSPESEKICPVTLDEIHFDS